MTTVMKSTHSKAETCSRTKMMPHSSFATPIYWLAHAQPSSAALEKTHLEELTTPSMTLRTAKLI